MEEGRGEEVKPSCGLNNSKNKEETATPNPNRVKDKTIEENEKKKKRELAKESMEDPTKEEASNIGKKMRMGPVWDPDSLGEAVAAASPRQSKAGREK